MKFKLINKTYLFQMKWGFLLLILPMIMLCLFLGNWQIHRYEYKKKLIAGYEQRLHSKPVLIENLHQPFKLLDFQPIAVQGYYLNALTMFIQNKFYKDHIGFEVLTPMQIIGTNKLLLVDRGFIPSLNFKIPPKIRDVQGQQSIKGYIKILNEYQFILGKNIIDPQASPIIMQKIVINEISQIVHHAFYPFILRLGDSETNGYIRHWIISTVPPQRHMGYAVQWFMLAFGLMIAYICFCCTRIK